jgi:hypothetical protein
MRSSRAAAALSVVAVLTLVPTSPAAAGGSWLAPSGDAYVVGDRVAARTPFGSGQLEGKVSDGPFTVYLIPAHRWIPRNGGATPAWAIPLGQLRIAEGNNYGMVASISFTVPDVPAGAYRLDYCNVPCTIDGIGDLAGAGSFAIGATLAEARLGTAVDKLQRKVESLERRARHVRELRAQLDDADQQAAALDTRNGELAASIERLGATIGELREQLRAARATSSASRTGLTIVLIALLVVTIGFVVMLNRSKRARRQRAVVPQDGPPSTTVNAGMPRGHSEDAPRAAEHPREGSLV